MQRRILYTMNDMGLRPDRGHVKSARVVGEVMGRLHPHGDTAIYDAMVRMAQPWSMRVPFIDGHGNFGSPDDSPAAMRYTEARMAPAAVAMTASIDEDTVDFKPNYDSRETEPTVLPAAIPNLIVNGTTGIAVGMATNIAPHNLVEVVQALRHLINHPKTDVDGLMRFIPGPDLPTGGKIVGLEGIRDAYVTGRGTFRMRATARIEAVTPRRKGIVVTELPYGVGTEKVIERIKTLVQGKKIQGISDVKDLTDREKGLRLVIEVKNGFHPEALLEQLYRQTPMEDTFGINTVALVDGQPRTLGLKELLEVFLGHRFDVVRRRSVFRRARAADRLHLVDGLITAILDIDEVIQLIRTSDDTAMARERLMQVFDLTETQTNYILEMPLRRLTKFSRIELEQEKSDLERIIEDLDAILSDEALLRKVVSDELAEVAKTYGTPGARSCSSPRAPPSPPPRSPSRSPTTPASRSSPPAACWPARPRTRPRAPAARAPTTTWWCRPSAPPRAARSASSPRGPGAQAGRARPADHPRLGQRPQPAGRRAALGGALAGLRGTRAGTHRASVLGARARARHAPGRRQAGEPRGAEPRRLGGHLAQGRRRVVGALDLAAGDALLHHLRRAAAALRGRRGAPAGPLGRRHRRRPGDRR